jgi:hypothetical protein
MLLCNDVRKEVRKYLVELVRAMLVEELPMTRQTYVALRRGGKGQGTGGTDGGSDDG